MSFQRRLHVLMLLAALASAAVWLRVAWLQVVQGDAWVETARRSRLSEIEQHARRGSIVDADGRLLVQDQPVLELVLVPGEWTQRERFRCEACGTLHYRKPKEGPPPRPRCCKSTSRRMLPLGAGDPVALERALGLLQGSLALRAGERLDEIEKQVAAYALRLKRAEDLDDDDFMVKDRIEAFRQNRRSLPVVLATEVSEEVARLVGLDESGALRGLRLRPAHVRRAVEAGPLARVLGQASLPDASDLERARAARAELDLDVPLGRAGLERHYDDLLRGTPGRELRSRSDEGGQPQVVESDPPRPGATLRLAASLEACAQAQRCLASLPNLASDYAPRTQPSAALIAMRADTGEIVALAELPAWQPPGAAPAWLPPGSDAKVRPLADPVLGDWIPARRLPGAPLPEADQRQQVERSTGFQRLLLPWRVRDAGLVPWDPWPEGFDHERWRASLAEPAGDYLSRISQVAVEPGSTMKVFIGLAMLESGLPLPIGGTFACEGKRGHPGCHNHVAVDFEAALEHSCNQYFAYSLRDFDAHWRTYRTSVAAFIDRLGFGQPTGSDVQGESRGTWLRAARWGAGERPEIPRDSGRMLAIGQGPVTATPLQLVRAVATLANGGRLVTPHLVQQVQRPGSPAAAPELPVLDLGLQPGNVARVREGMRRAVYGDSGTARVSFPWGTIPARVYGKTGTSQVPRSWRPFHPGEVSRDVTHQWFVGFAEAEGQPPLAFAVVYHARLESAAGATAAGIAGAFLQWWYGR